MRQHSFIHSFIQNLLVKGLPCVKLWEAKINKTWFLLRMFSKSGGGDIYIPPIPRVMCQGHGPEGTQGAVSHGERSDGGELP